MTEAAQKVVKVCEGHASLCKDMPVEIVKSVRYCCIHKRIYHNNWLAKNRNKFKLIKTAYRNNNRNKINQYAREYRSKNLSLIRLKRRTIFRQRERNLEKKYIKELRDLYIRKRLRQDGIPPEEITCNLIQIKKFFIKIKRLTKEEKNHDNQKR